MKVAHFSDGDNYGALGAAYELHKKMLDQGIESRFFLRIKSREDACIEEISDNTVLYRLRQLIHTIYFDRNRTDTTMFFSYNRLGIELTEDILSRLREYDIIHFHWIARFLNNEDIRKIISLGKPIVWTMHDFNPMTGGCHYPDKCIKFFSDCSECPQLAIKKLNVTSFVLKDKRCVYGNKIHVVVASKWLKKLVERSYVFSDAKCSLIPIGIDVEHFRILNRKKCKKNLGFSEDTKIILMGAQSVKAKTKGYAELVEIFGALKEEQYIRRLMECDKIKLVSFGYGGEVFESLGIPNVNMGFINDRDQLCEIYNAADVFIFPSTQETFGMTAVESMACGTPVIAYNVCAMQDIIINGINGYKIDRGNNKEMVQILVKVLRDAGGAMDPYSCRKRIVEKYSLQYETNEMLHLYDHLCHNFIDDCRSIAERNNNEMLNLFESMCTYEIMERSAINQKNEETLQSILFPLSPAHIIPEKKIDLLLKNEILRKQDEIIIYGAGHIGQKIMAELEKNGMNIIEIWDTDNSKWDNRIGEYIVKKPEKKCAGWSKKIIVASAKCVEISKILDGFEYQFGVDYI